MIPVLGQGSFLFYMRAAVVLVIVLAGIYSFNREDIRIEKLPSVELRSCYKNVLDSTVLALKATKLQVESGNDDEIRKEMLRARLSFKEIEFILAYLDPQLFNYAINGAPLPKVKKKLPELSIAEPAGFQRIEELIHEEEIDRKLLLIQLNDLMTELALFGNHLYTDQLTDPVFFEAARFGIIRVMTLGVTGFDCPGGTENTLRETQMNLKGITRIVRAYGSFYEATDEVLALLSKGEHELSNADFDSFDRANFIRKILDPLWRETLKMQVSLNVELPHQRNTQPSAVNYQAGSLFANDFLRAEYFAENNPNDSLRIALGKILFFDPVLSVNNERACASCHQPNKGFADGREKPLNLGFEGVGLRNSPTVYNSLYAERYFHDLRVDRLAFQMDHVVLSKVEFGTDYDEIVSKLNQSVEYKKLFNKAYGNQGVSKNTVNNAVMNYVASLRSFDSNWDRFIRNETDEMDDETILGFNLFMGKAACATCHFAPVFSGLVPPFYMESESEVLGIPATNRKPYQLDSDMGRFDNKIVKERALFYQRSFKTPTVRNSAQTAPYMHNGVFPSLKEVVEFYNNGGGTGLELDVPFQTLPQDSLQLNRKEQKALIKFMESLTDFSAFDGVPDQLPGFNNPVLDRRTIGGRY